MDVLEDGIVRVRPEVAEEVAEELAAVSERRVWFSPRSGTVYVSRPTQAGVATAAQLQMAVKSGADEETIRRLVDEIAAASTRGDGNRVVLGAWKAGGGYIGDAVENGGVFFDTGDEVWDMLTKSGVDPWLINEAFLRRQLEAGVERIEFIGEDIASVITNLKTANTFRAQEVKWLLENAGKYGYTRLGNKWVLRP
ncbi:MAG: hypothetical protein ACK8QZ_05490 [Anaerolineales bacterium]